MRRWRVYIATTDGPSEVLSLKRLPSDPALPNIQSAICLNGSSDEIPISRNYARFVPRSTGIIEAMTGHRAFRMAVSRPITNGDSWQLGIYLAHALEQAGALSQKGEAADAAVLVTGEVNLVDHSVTAVGGMAEKLATAEALLTDRTHEGMAVRVLCPVANAAEVPADGRYDVMPVGSLDTARAALGLPGHAEAHTTPQSPTAPDKLPVKQPVAGPAPARRGWGLLSALGAVALAGLALAGWQQAPEEWTALVRGNPLSQSAPSVVPEESRETVPAKVKDTVPLALSIRPLRPADGGSCAGMRFRDTELMPGAPVEAADNRLSVGAAVCALSIELRNPTDRLRHAWAGIRPGDRKHSFRRARREARVRRAVPLDPGGVVALKIDLPRFRGEILTYTVTAMSATQAASEVGQLFDTVRRSGSRSLEGYKVYGLSMLERRLTIVPAGGL